MNPIRLNKLCGFYEPAFFRMHVSTTEPIVRLNELTPESFGVLVHEYIHFIQDLTTIYGLTNVYNTVQFLKYALNRIYTSGDCFSVPITPDGETFNGKMIRFNSTQRNITYGGNKQYTPVVIESYHRKTIKIEEHCNQAGIVAVELGILVNGKDRTTYNFGACCILESMAYLLEQHLMEGENEISDMPYHAAKKVAEHIYKEFAEDDLRVLALCDISLNSSNPGDIFVSLLERWRNESFLPENPRELYDYLYMQQFVKNEETDKGTVKRYETFFRLYENTIALVRESLHSYFKEGERHSTEEPPIIPLINKWIDEILQSALKWRMEHPCFLLDIAEKGGQASNKAFFELYNEFGLPFCTNDNHDGCFYHPRINRSDLQLNLFLVVGQMYKILGDKPVACKLQEYCYKCKEDETGDVVPDIRCLSPWLRANDKQLCPFAFVWRHWNLTGRKPIVPLY